MRAVLALLLLPTVLLAADSPGVRINEDRVKRLKAATMPKVEKVIPFDTPEADAVLAALEVFPPDNPWNIPVDQWPVHPRSKQIIATVGVDKPLRCNSDMGFVIVPPDQKKVTLLSVEYKDESDAGPFPIPDTAFVEGWPSEYKRNPARKNWTLDDVQRDKNKQGGDRHVIVVDPGNRKLYEFFSTFKTDAGWKAAQASVFDLSSNKLRPAGWTSADAAGLPIFPAVIRYDELKRGVIDHALRVTVRRSQRAYVYPATHFASRLTDKDLSRMGERIRLRKDFDTSKFGKEVKVILEALKTYGMFVADNGIEWGMSSAPDERIPLLHEELRKVKGSDFEVVTPPDGYKPPK